jgi:hypothetical protein
MYDRDTIQRLLPHAFDHEYAYGVTNPLKPDPDMPRGEADSSCSNTLWACIADIHTAWNNAGLTRAEQQIVYTRHVLGWRWRDITKRLGYPRNVATKRAEEGVGRLRDYLEGTL